MFARRLFFSISDSIYPTCYAFIISLICLIHSLRNYYDIYTFVLFHCDCRGVSYHQDWVQLDDIKVTHVGNYDALIDKCVRGRLQPILLLFSTSTAATATTRGALASSMNKSAQSIIHSSSASHTDPLAPGSTLRGLKPSQYPVETEEGVLSLLARAFKVSPIIKHSKGIRISPLPIMAKSHPSTSPPPLLPSPFNDMEHQIIETTSVHIDHVLRNLSCTPDTVLLPIPSMDAILAQAKRLDSSQS